MEGQANSRVSELNKQKMSIQIVYKFVPKLLKYKILFKDILTFLILDYRDASLKILNLVVIGIIVPKSFKKNNYIINNCCQKSKKKS